MNISFAVCWRERERERKSCEYASFKVQVLLHNELICCAGENIYKKKVFMAVPAALRNTQILNMTFKATIEELFAAANGR